jgi:uncharacterized protein (DUF2164 family)
MAVALSAEARTQALASIRRFYTANFAPEIGELEVASILEFFLKEIAPTVYNGGVADAQAYLRDRLADLEGICYEPEFVYWPKSPSVRRKNDR